MELRVVVAMMTMMVKGWVKSAKYTVWNIKTQNVSVLFFQTHASVRVFSKTRIINTELEIKTPQVIGSFCTKNHIPQHRYRLSFPKKDHPT